ncbi:hypothetical protein PQO03_09240 [Lentisphaera profundi]|uniref:Uncharacterized protein n=1 Tax=Lentisphaera profundi TaxID=1658616 RepID=A0ABY7VQA1_9BACT|nr:hypothetical protein [Lentisphaera profundi]WDE95899.1 hypothetical protein PQO03_09240 [Lentisphaera profundi]
MSFNIPTALKSLASAGSAISELSKWLKKSKGDSRALLSELKNNLTYFDLIINDSLPLNEIIDKISSQEFMRLSKDGYNFNCLKDKKIPNYPSLQNTALASWAGKDTEDLVESIYDRINDLKIRYPLVCDKENYRWQIRVNNIRKRIWLLLRHIKNN